MTFASHIVNALPPVADVEDTSFDSDVINAQGEEVIFIYYTGANAGGDSVITVEACDNVTPSNQTAIPFTYSSIVATDIPSDWAAATAAGFTTSQVANAFHVIKVDPAELAEEGYGYVRLSATEDTNAAVLGGVLAIVVGGRYEHRSTTLLT